MKKSPENLSSLDGFLSESKFFERLVEEHASKTDAVGQLEVIADSIREGLFAQQRQLVEDPNRRKAALCPRRAGKSFTAISYAFDVALRKRGARVVLIGLALPHMKNVYWFDMMHFGQTYGIPCKYNQNELRITLNNNSMIRLVGADSYQEIEKLRGGQYDLVVIDECKSFAPRLLDELIQQVIEPALRDRRGTLLLIGTPGNTMRGTFFEVTYPGWTDSKKRLRSKDAYAPESYWDKHPKARYWSRHHWTIQDNVRQPHQWAEAVSEKDQHGWGDDEPIWRRESLGEWVASSDAFVYAYASLVATDPDLVTWTPDYRFGNRWGLPLGTDWRYVMGLDLGYEDSTAIVVAAYSPESKTLYHVYDYQAPHLDAYQIADLVETTTAKFERIDAFVADTGALGKTLIETLRRRHGFSIVPAEKREKFDYIELLNADFRAGRARLLATSDLSLQMQHLQFDLRDQTKEFLARAQKLKENPTMRNDLCDAFLYLWRYSYHYWSEPVQVPPEISLRERLARAQHDVMDRLVAERNKSWDQTIRETWASDLDINTPYGRYN